MCETDFVSFDCFLHSRSTNTTATGEAKQMKLRNNKRVCWATGLCGLLTVLVGPTVAIAQQQSSSTKSSSSSAGRTAMINPEADRIFKETSALISQAKSFSVSAEVWEDEVVGAHKVATSKTVDVKLRRPNLLQVEGRSPRHTRGFWLNGKTLTILDRTNNLYGTVPVTGTIDEVLDTAQDRFGITFPLEDFLVSDPYEAMAHIKGGAYLGKATILGTPCKYVAFSTDKVDWQLWVDTSQGLPRKLVITYKDERTQPQYTAIFSNWKLNAELPDATFTFTPPKGASKIEIVPAMAQLTPTGRTNEPATKSPSKK